jgi:hypothetical protein
MYPEVLSAFFLRYAGTPHPDEQEANLNSQIGRGLIQWDGILKIVACKPERKYPMPMVPA